jgi:tetratricopeptide (TPR) repeat protein
VAGVPDASDILAEISPLGDNKLLIPRLVDQLQSSRVIIPFVGAGLSAPYHLPEWRPLLQELAPTPETRSEVDRLLDANDYEGAAEYLLEVRGPARFQEQLKNALQAPLEVSKETAVTALMRFPAGPIITTNFDRVLEEVFKAEGIDVRVIIGDERQKIEEVFQFNKNALLKIHGDMASPNDTVIAFSQYEKAYTSWLSTILRNLATNPLLFVGYSLRNDRPMRVLEQLVREGQVLARHYAILPMPATGAELIERMRYLSESLRVDAIWYPAGRHECVETLLSYLADQVPAERQRNWKMRTGPLHSGLPAAPFKLYGREEQSADLLDAVDKFPVVVVEGNRGSGKTAFALDALRQLLLKDTFGALVWVTAQAQKEHLRLEDIFQQISRTIDYPFAPLTKEQQEEKLAAELERKKVRCLLLLDNYETVADPDIKSFLGRPPAKLHVLITSSGRLVPEADYRIVLDDLSETDALTLFRARLTRDGLDPEPQADLKRLYEVVGGNPLALEWIVGQLRLGKRLPRLLDSLARGKADILQRVFEQSWKGLQPAAQTLLTAMAVFVKPALEPGMIAASGLDEESFDAAFEQLSRMYLLRRLQMQEGGQARQVNARKYFIHPFTRDYIENCRQPAVASAMYGRAAEFYLGYVQERGGTPNREEVNDQYELNDQRENMLGVLNGCMSFGKEEPLVSLTQAMARWLFIESHWGDLKTWGDEAARIAIKIGKAHAAAAIINEAGRVYSYQSEYTKAEETFQTAVKLASTDPPDLRTLAYIRHHQGEARIRQEKFEEASQLLTQSLEGFKAIASARDVIGVRYRLAMLALKTGDLEEAKKLGEQGLRDTDNERWDRLKGFNHRLLGDVAVRQKDLREARFHYLSALKLVPTSDMRIQALIELSLAHLEHEVGNKDEAEKLASAAKAHFDKIDMRSEADDASKLLLAIRAGA